MNLESKVVELRPNQDVSSRHKDNKTAYNAYSGSNGGGNGGGDMLEPRVAKLESDVSYIRRDVNELKIDVKSIDKNMTIVLERLESIKESLNKKPSADAVDKKISDAKLAILLGVPAILGTGTAIYKAIMHFYFSS
jgi:hypothetical protein